MQFPTLFWNTVWHGAVKPRFSTTSPVDCLRALLPTVDLDFLRPSHGRPKPGEQPRAGTEGRSVEELEAVEDAAFFDYDLRRQSSIVPVSRLVREYDSRRQSSALPHLLRVPPCRCHSAQLQVGSSGRITQRHRRRGKRQLASALTNTKLE